MILTTLTGERVDSFNTVLDLGYYGSVPTALLHIVQDLDQWLHANPARPSVMDPSGSGVSFDHRWDDATYETFRDQIHDYAADIAAAYDEPDMDTSVGLWQDIFGDGFRAPAAKQTSGRFGPVASVPSRPGRAG